MSAKNHIRYLLIIVTIACILATIGYVQYENKKREYTNFSKSELETIPLFDALNENVAQGLPPLPQGSSLLKKWSVGINAPLYEHGRWLFMKFSTNQQSSDILEYYRAFFTQDGWSENTSLHAFDDLFFFKGTSCIEIIPPSEIYSYFSIYIWHDYARQTFSPTLPDERTMSWFEHGLTNIAVCP